MSIRLIVLTVLLLGCGDVEAEAPLTPKQFVWWAECVKINPTRTNVCSSRAREVTD